jgi:hypothetical protein
MMKPTRNSKLTIMISLVVLIAITSTTAFAQGGEFRDDFEDGNLEGWEHSEGVVSENGVLQVPPENFAVRFGDFIATSYSFDYKQTGTGVIVFRYAIGKGYEYTLILHDEGIVLERAQEGPPVILAEAPWESVLGNWVTVEISTSQSGQQISLDGNQILTTEEEEILQGGGIGFWVEGEDTVEFDNLILESDQPIPGEEIEESPPEDQELLPEETPMPGDSSQDQGRISLDDLIIELTSAQANPTQLSTFIVNLGLSVVLSFILSRVYIHWGSSLSNRRRFSANFILITVTTTFIILVVRSSVALSLGLVGALSIVRFRSAIKEPEELAYLFFAIGIGIGLGDNQRLITIIALAVAIIVLGLMRLFRGRKADFNLHVTIASQDSASIDFETIVDTLRGNTTQMRLIRFDENERAQEISFLAEFKDMNQLKEARVALRGLSESIQISFLDNKGIW